MTGPSIGSVTRPRRRGRVLGLLLGCHPLPTLAVTVFTTAYAVALGAGPGRAISVAAAVVAGQLVVGWTNDAIDAPRDRVAQRPDKPVSNGLIEARTLIAAAAIATIAAVVLSFRLGFAAGGLHLVAIVSAVGYNARLKATVWSPLPYLISFGLLPVVVTFAVAGVGPVPVAQIVAAALLGGAAHAGNTVGDAAADAVTGVRGLPQRLGPERSLVIMAVLVALAAIVLLATVFVGPDLSAGRRTAAVVLLPAGALLATVGAVRRVGVPGGRGAWRLTLAAVAVVIAGFLITV